MKPHTRADLARLVPASGLIIELGVAAGAFAEELMRANPSARYVGIDRWSDHHNEAEMATAMSRIIPNRGQVIRSTFADMVANVPDDEADLIYIDGYAHTGQEGGETLRDWWAKLKPGGIFAGHDYSGHYPQTIAAVDDFVRGLGLAVTTNLRIIDELPHPSWWLVKPDPTKP